MAKKGIAGEIGAPWPRALDAEGCLFGRAVQERVERLSGRVNDVETDVEKGIGDIRRKVDKLTLAVLAAALSFAGGVILILLTGG